MVAETRSALYKKRKLAHASTERALGLTELLTAILLHTDQQTLLVATQRTCKRWHEVIHSTPSLRRHLFLDVPCESGADDRCRVFNPLLVEAFGSFFKNKRVADEDPVSVDRATSISRYGLIPFTKLSKGITPKGQKVTYKDWRTGRVQKLEKTSPFLRVGASWLRMHVTDPPTVRVGIFSESGQWGMFKVACTTDIDGGLRMQDLYTTFLLGQGMGRTLAWPRNRKGTFLVEESRLPEDQEDPWPRARDHVVSVEAELMIYSSYTRSCGKGMGVPDHIPWTMDGAIFFSRCDMMTASRSFLPSAVARRRRVVERREHEDYDEEEELVPC